MTAIKPVSANDIHESLKAMETTTDKADGTDKSMKNNDEATNVE